MEAGCDAARRGAAEPKDAAAQLPPGAMAPRPWFAETSGRLRSDAAADDVFDDVAVADHASDKHGLAATAGRGPSGGEGSDTLAALQSGYGVGSTSPSQASTSSRSDSGADGAGAITLAAGASHRGKALPPPPPGASSEGAPLKASLSAIAGLGVEKTWPVMPQRASSTEFPDPAAGAIAAHKDDSALRQSSPAASQPDRERADLPAEEAGDAKSVRTASARASQDGRLEDEGESEDALLRHVDHLQAEMTRLRARLAGRRPVAMSDTTSTRSMRSVPPAYDIGDVHG